VNNIDIGLAVVASQIPTSAKFPENLNVLQGYIG